MLGHVCVASCRTRFEVEATVRDLQSAAAAELGVELHRFDAYDAAPRELLERLRPEVVVNCIAMVKQLSETEDARAAIRVNSLFPRELADACTAVGARLIQVSTDAVFSGRLPIGERYREDDFPDPQDLYGRTKLLGEVGPPHLTLRTSIIGRELRSGSGLLEWLRRQEGSVISGFRRAIFSGLTTHALAELIAEVAGRHPDLAGLYHVAGEPISKYELLLLLRDVLSIECEIEPVDEPLMNRALDGSRFTAATGLRVPSWNTMLESYRAA